MYPNGNKLTGKDGGGGGGGGAARCCLELINDKDCFDLIRDEGSSNPNDVIGDAISFASVEVETDFLTIGGIHFIVFRDLLSITTELIVSKMEM